MAYAWRSLEQPAYRRLNFVAGMRRVTWACAARYIARKPSYIREKEGGVVLCDTPRRFQARGPVLVPCLRTPVLPHALLGGVAIFYPIHANVFFAE